MHMSDALLSPPVAGAMIAASAVATVCAARVVRRESAETDRSIVPAMGVLAAFVFAAQMINFSIPGTGSSGHLCGGMLLSATLGPAAGFLSMIGVLLIQCLLFADGGLLALGANVWNMAFYGCFLGGGVIWPLFVRKGATRGRILAASVIGSIVTLQLGALSVTLETLASGITELPFGTFLKAMLPIHLAIGLVEGLVTAAVLIFLYETRPVLLRGVGETDRKSRLGPGPVLAILAAATLVTGGLLSLVASGDPDGLEWSMEKVAGTTELENPEASAHASAERIQERTALLPDYAFASDGEDGSTTGTIFSGIAGSAAVLFLCAGICLILRARKSPQANA